MGFKNKTAREFEHRQLPMVIAWQENSSFSGIYFQFSKQSHRHGLYQAASILLTIILKRLHGHMSCSPHDQEENTQRWLTSQLFTLNSKCCSWNTTVYTTSLSFGISHKVQPKTGTLNYIYLASPNLYTWVQWDNEHLIGQEWFLFKICPLH